MEKQLLGPIYVHHLPVVNFQHCSTATTIQNVLENYVTGNYLKIDCPIWNKDGKNDHNSTDCLDLLHISIQIGSTIFHHGMIQPALCSRHILLQPWVKSRAVFPKKVQRKQLWQSTRLKDIAKISIKWTPYMKWTLSRVL